MRTTGGGNGRRRLRGIRRQIDIVRIPTGHKTFEISWDDRNEILRRCQDRQYAGPLVDAFERHGTGSPVLLTHNQKIVLAEILSDWLHDAETVHAWMDEVGLPQPSTTIAELRDGLASDVR